MATTLNEYWSKIDHPEDDEPSHEANVTMTETGYQVAWYHTAVGQVTTEDFDDLGTAYDWLEDRGYVYQADLGVELED